MVDGQLKGAIIFYRQGGQAVCLWGEFMYDGQGGQFFFQWTKMGGGQNF